MAKFSWKGIDKGKQNSGVLDAADIDAAKKQLAAQQIIVTHIDVVEDDAESKSDDAPRKKYYPKKIKSKEIMVFSKKFATMVQSGLPILKTLKMLQDQAENPNLKTVVYLIYKDVESGSTLSDAFAKHPKVFDTIYINLLRAGEESGKLTLFLRKLVVQIEKTQKLKSKIRGALMYPIILMVVATVVIIIMLVKVVPVFQKMFSSMGHDLPGPTQLIVDISAFLRDPMQGGVVFGVGVVGFFVMKYLVKNNDKVRHKFHRFILKMPLIGNIVQKSILSKVAMIHGNLSAAGVSILDSLDIISSTITNMIYKDAFLQIKNGVSEGQPLSVLYAKFDDIFPPTFSQMIAVGEETGNMDEMFESIAGYFEEEFDMAVDTFTELLEPIMIVFMGTTIGFIIVAMYMPIFQVGKVVSH